METLKARRGYSEVKVISPVRIWLITSQGVQPVQYTVCVLVSSSVNWTEGELHQVAVRVQIKVDKASDTE